MSLFCIKDELCRAKGLVGDVCSLVSEISAANEALCQKIAEAVGDPDAECPPCPEPTPAVEEAAAETAAITATTETIKAQTEAIKSSLQPAQKGEAA